MKTFQYIVSPINKALKMVLVLMFGLLIIQGVHAQELTCSGIIEDFDTGEPITDHEVLILVYQDFGTILIDTLIYTDQNGYYEAILLLDAPMDGYEVYIQTPDCFDVTMEMYLIDELPGEIDADFDICWSVFPECYAFFDIEYEEDSLTVKFDESCEGDIVSWQWDFGDGGVSDEQNPTYTYEQAGEYEVCLSIENSDGSCEDIYCDYVFLFESECANSFQYTQTEGTTFEFSGFVFPDVDAEYYWTIYAEEPVYLEGQEITYTFELEAPQTSQFFVVVLETVSDLGDLFPCFATSQQFIYVASEDTCNISFTIDTIDLYSYQFFNTSDDDLIDLNWSFGDGFHSVDENPIHEYNQPGVYNVCLTAYCIATHDTIEFCMELVIIDGCEANFSFTMDTLNLQSGYYSFVDQSVSGEILSWAWDFGDGGTSAEQNPNHYFAFEGEYEMCLSIQTLDGCSDTICKTIFIDSFYRLGGHILLEEAYMNNPIYNNDTAVVSLYRIQEDDRVYKMGTISVSDTNSYYSFPHLHEGKYLVRAELSIGSPHYSEFVYSYSEQELIWHKADVIELDENKFAEEVHLSRLDEYTNGSIAVSGELVFTELMDESMLDTQNFTIILMNSDGGVIKHIQSNGLMEFRFEDLSPGTYKLYADVPGYYSEMVEILIQNETIVLNDVFIHLFDDDPTGEDEFVDNSGYNLYPNPFQNELYLRTNNEGSNEYTIVVYDVMGIEKYNLKIEVFGDDVIKIELPLLPSGIYIISLHDQMGEFRFTRKIIKK
ncbi:MAG: PKD domain-containing protein [Bacteroidales bacterium]|nr:PKD domain-containing protein [Bacteroidales bacterium]